MKQIFLVVGISLFIFCKNLYADSAEQNIPCTSSSSLFSLVDRPSKADSSCTIPYGNVMLETGYQYLNLIGGSNSQNFPQATIRVGLPQNTEIFAFVPSYNIQTDPSLVGFGATTVGIKHIIHYNQKWIWSAEALITPSSGSADFGSDGTGYTVNGIAAYTINNYLSATLMLGVSSQVLPENSDGQRFTSVNPDVLLSWQLNNQWGLFGEVFAQSKAAPNQDGGVDVDGGIQFLAAKRILLDVEAGQRGYGEIGGFNNYFGFGGAILFG